MAQQNAPATSPTEARHAPKSLGSLEKLIMDALWARDSPLTVQEVVEALGPDHNYKTVMTVLNRLVDKELLGRELDGRAYRYLPRHSRVEFLQAVADELVSDYIATYGDTSGTHLRKAIDVVMPAPPAPASAAPPAAALIPPAPVYEDQNDRRSSGIMGVIGVAAVLQAITLFFRRRKSH